MMLFFIRYKGPPANSKCPCGAWLPSRRSQAYNRLKINKVNKFQRSPRVTMVTSPFRMHNMRSLAKRDAALLFIPL